MTRAATLRRLAIPLAAAVCAGVAGAAQASTGASVAGLTVSPAPGTPDASATTTISLFGAPVAAVREIRVRGSRTGLHRGALASFTGAVGSEFVPLHRFSHGEVVSVRLTTLIRGKQRRDLFRFRVGRHAGIGLAPGSAPPQSALGAERYVSRPDLHPPTLKVSTSAASRAAGNLFVAPIVGPGQRPPLRGQFGPTIYDDSGQLVWHGPVPRGQEAFNFRVQSYQGAPVLTWWQGKLSFLGFGFGENIVMDGSYHVLAHVRAGNGYHADLHEFTIDPQGYGWLTAYAPVTVTVGGRHHRHSIAVLDSVVQRIDIRTGTVVFEWHALGHIPLRESYVKRPLGLPWDAYHVNSIEVDSAGNFFISARNTWAAYLVSGRSGRILWRLGGKRSDYRMGRGTRFAWQHDAHRQADGSVTIFDDEAAPASATSRAGSGLRSTRRTTAPRSSTATRKAAGGGRQPGQRAGAAERERAGGLGRAAVHLGVQPGRQPAVRSLVPAPGRVVPRLPLPLDGHAGHAAARRGAQRRRQGHRLRELERRHAGGQLARARGRDARCAGAGGGRRAHRLRDDDSARGAFAVRRSRSAGLRRAIARSLQGGQGFLIRPG